MRATESTTFPAGRALALSLALLAVTPNAAWAQAPTAPSAGVSAGVAVPPPLPPERPAELKPAAPDSSGGRAEGAVPTPPARPAELAPSTPPSADLDKPEIPVPPPTPPARPPELSGEAALALKVAPPDDTACRTRLTRLGVAFQPLPPISEGQCSAPLPLRVSALADGVALPQGATLTCRAAEGLARWATEVQVAAGRAFGHPLTALEIGGSYVCRGQNHDLDAKLSEHAFAGAVDIMAFSIAGRAAVPVKGLAPGSVEAEFLAEVRTKACAFFRTVLGPGSNAAHADHLHLDERERTAGHRLCE